MPQCCTHRPGVNCVQANTCPCQADNCPCTSGFQSENCYNRGPIRAPTAPRLTTKVRQNIEKGQEAAPKLYQSTPPGHLSPRQTGVLAQYPHERIRLACLTGARQHRQIVSSVFQERCPQPRHTSIRRKRQNKFKLRTTNRRLNCVTQSARQPRQ